MEDLLGKHNSKPHNPRIAHVFYLAGFIESWGRGVEKIFRSCEEDGLAEPVYTIHPRDLMIRFDAPADRVIHRNGTTNVPINVPINVSLNLSEMDIGGTQTARNRTSESCQIGHFYCAFEM